MVNIKHFLIVGLVISIIGVSPLCASDVSMLDALDITPFSEDTVVTIDGIDFNIPKGYGEEVGVLTKDGEIEEINGVNFITFSHRYINDDAKSISIDIFYDEHQLTGLDSLSKTSGEVDKTINGNEGLFLQEDGYCSFTYTLDGKTIMITAENETMISNTMI